MFTVPVDRPDAYDEYWRYSPRYIHGDVIGKMMYHEIDGDSPFESIEEFLDATRRLKFYADLENVFPYEITNVYSYEFALRTKRVKSHLKRREGTGSDQMADVPHVDDWWFDIDIVMKFERLRYDIHYLKTVGWKQKKWDDKSPEETFPKVKVPGSATEYAELKLNMYLPKDELVSYLEAYIENMKVAKNDNDEHETLSKHVKSKIKIMKPQRNIPDIYHDILGRLKKPRCLKAFKMAETFYAYDMVSMGFDEKDIADAVKRYRAKTMYRLNKSLEMHLDEKDFYEMLLVDVEPQKTIRAWYELSKDIVDTGQYKRVVAPKRTTDSLSDEGYL